jgi:hypothetical protein
MPTIEQVLLLADAIDNFRIARAYPTIEQVLLLADAIDNFRIARAYPYTRKPLAIVLVEAWNRSEVTVGNAAYNAHRAYDHWCESVPTTDEERALVAQLKELAAERFALALLAEADAAQAVEAPSPDDNGHDSAVPPAPPSSHPATPSDGEIAF